MNLNKLLEIRVIDNMKERTYADTRIEWASRQRTFPVNNITSYSTILHTAELYSRYNVRIGKTIAFIVKVRLSIGIKFLPKFLTPKSMIRHVDKCIAIFDKPFYKTDIKGNESFFGCVVLNTPDPHKKYDEIHKCIRRNIKDKIGNVKRCYNDDIVDYINLRLITDDVLRKL